jgi:YHS domain-containing protein
VDKEDKIASRFGIRSIPTDVFLSSAGQEFHRNLTTPSATDYVSLLDQLAIQTGIGGARQATLHERESQYDLRQPTAEQPPPAPQQYVQNQFAPQNRYSNQPAQAAAGSVPPQQAAAAASSEGPMMYGGWGGAAMERPLSQNGPYGPPSEQRQANPGEFAGNVPQGGNYAPNSEQSTQHATFQDPGDITARQPIRNQFIEVKNAPPFGLEGYCPVSLREGGKWRKGDKQFGAVHRGRTYLFASANEQQKFLTDPDAYSPVLSGADPVIFAEQGQIVEGNRNFGISLPSGKRAEMYFFASAETRDRFEKNPKQYAINAHQAMLRSETEQKFR